MRLSITRPSSRLFLVYPCSCSGDRFALIQSRDGARLVQPPEFKEDFKVQRAIKMYDNAHALRGAKESKYDLHFWQYSCPDCPEEKRIETQSYEGPGARKKRTNITAS